jgi:hypothetical protein
MIALLALTGCDKPLMTTLHGAVYSSHDPMSGGLPGASVRIVDGQGAEVASTTTDDSGAFDVELESGQSVFVLVDADGYATSTFTGNVGIEADAEVEDHAIYGVSDQELADVLATFAGCEGAGGPGAVVFGEVHEYGLYTNNGAPLVAPQATAVVEHGGDSWPGCYLDDDGVAHDPDAVMTGASGRFAAFGVGEGRARLVVQTQLDVDLWTYDAYPLFVPKSDRRVVSPWYPAFATFPAR